ncbi:MULTISPECIES: M20/M25/M40 family metallo-hydrolase [Myxococcaceae]|uniref:M20/M25/M40 family metallo-hydrolase n=1 Tax=Myxococcaceae TaxID=31 RepID=UPI00188DD92D
MRSEDVRAHVTVLAADDMEGRLTGSPGAARAADYIAGQLGTFGVTPAGDDGFFQRVPLKLDTRYSPPRLVLVPPGQDPASVPEAERRTGLNVVGRLEGADPALKDEVVVVGAHYDHLGVGPAVNGDAIYNGADDDASGVAAVLEAARALAQGPRPRRTVLFIATTGEEEGTLGAKWYLQHPVAPLERTVAELEVEMIGRPDPLVGGAGHLWLTGYERSTMGESFTHEGLEIVADPRPAQHFYERSDNIAFARLGIPAHTLSSYNLHADYHTPADEVSRLDIAHMTQAIESIVSAVRLLADGDAPQWKPGLQPQSSEPVEPVRSLASAG